MAELAKGVGRRVAHVHRYVGNFAIKGGQKPDTSTKVLFDVKSLPISPFTVDKWNI